MSSLPQVARLSHTHLAVMDWILANPHLNLGDCARAFGYTQAWLSCLIHSDVFQAVLREKQGVLFGETVMTVKDRVIGLANVSLRRITERVESGAMENSDLVKTTDMALSAMGFTGQANGMAVEARGVAELSEEELVQVVSERKVMTRVRRWNEKSSPAGSPTVPPTTTYDMSADKGGVNPAPTEHLLDDSVFDDRGEGREPQPHSLGDHDGS